MSKDTLELQSKARKGLRFRICAEHLFKLGPHTEYPHGKTNREGEALPSSSKPVVFSRIPSFRGRGSSVREIRFNQQIACLNQPHKLGKDWQDITEWRRPFQAERRTTENG